MPIQNWLMQLIECKRASECVSEWERPMCFFLFLAESWLSFSHHKLLFMTIRSFSEHTCGYQPEPKRYSLSEYFSFYLTDDRAVLVVAVAVAAVFLCIKFACHAFSAAVLHSAIKVIYHWHIESSEWRYQTILAINLIGDSNLYTHYYLVAKASGMKC